MSNAANFEHLPVLKLRGTVRNIGRFALMFSIYKDNAIGLLQIGSPEEPSELQVCGEPTREGILCSDDSYKKFFTKAVIYKKTGVFVDSVIDGILLLETIPEIVNC
jgi:hypothetical protein